MNKKFFLPDSKKGIAFSKDNFLYDFFGQTIKEINCTKAQEYYNGEDVVVNMVEMIELSNVIIKGLGNRFGYNHSLDAIKKTFDLNRSEKYLLRNNKDFEFYYYSKKILDLKDLMYKSDIILYCYDYTLTNYNDLLFKLIRQPFTGECQKKARIANFFSENDQIEKMNTYISQLCKENYLEFKNGEYCFTEKSTTERIY